MLSIHYITFGEYNYHEESMLLTSNLPSMLQLTFLFLSLQCCFLPKKKISFHHCILFIFLIKLLKSNLTNELFVFNASPIISAPFEPILFSYSGAYSVKIFIVTSLFVFTTTIKIKFSQCIINPQSITYHLCSIVSYMVDYKSFEMIFLKKRLYSFIFFIG